jgi:predicted amidohydrolase YtcJ
MVEQQGGLLLTGGRVYTADPDRPWAEAVLTRGTTIAYVGSAAAAHDMATAGTEWLDLPGTLILPGLNDSHIHTNWGGHALEMLDLDGVNTLAELQDALRAFTAAHPERRWILGTGLAYEALAQEVCPRLALDAVIADRPVYLRALDWHSAWANTQALAIGGILDGAEVPKPNEVVVDQDGRATGLLREHLATELITNHIPPYTSEEEDASLIGAFRYLNSFGITSVQNMHGDPRLVQRYRALREQGRQTVRALHYMRIDEPAQRERLPEFAALSARTVNEPIT